MKKCKYCSNKTTGKREICNNCLQYSRHIQFFKRYGIEFNDGSGLETAFRRLQDFVRKKVDGKNGIYVKKLLQINKSNSIKNYLRSFGLYGEIKIMCPTCCNLHYADYQSGVFCSEKCKQNFIKIFRNYGKTSKTLKSFNQKVREIAKILNDNLDSFEHKYFELINTGERREIYA